MTVTNSLPSIKENFQETWQRLMNGLLPAFIIAVLTFVVTLITTLVFIVIGIVLFAGSINMASVSNGLDALSTLPPAAYGFGFILLLLFILVVVAIAATSQAAQLMAFETLDRKLKVKDLLKRAVGVVPAMIGLGLVGSVLWLGSFWLLVVPSIMVGVLLIFSIYQVVLDGVGPMEAIKQSTGMVLDHFGYVVSRLVIFFVLYVFIFVVLPGLVEELVFLTLIFSVFWSWFSIAYMISLYQAIKKAGYNKNASTHWLWIMAIMGWLIFAFAFKAIKNFADSKLARQIEQELTGQLEIPSSGDYDYDIDYPTTTMENQKY